MHIADVEKGILGANGIVGGGMGIATGAGLSAKLLGNGRVSVCFFGDGALNQGILHESMNLAAIWKLPVIYVCENNQFAMSARVQVMTAVSDPSIRAVAYGIPGVNVDGMDVLTVFRAASEAVERARAGEGPSFIVATTYRFLGHHVGDPLNYRTKEEVDVWREKTRSSGSARTSSITGSPRKRRPPRSSTRSRMKSTRRRSSPRPPPSRTPRP